MNKRFIFLLPFFFILVYILPLGHRSLVIPDETRYAEVPREMIASGNWISPHLNGLKYFEKPVLGYWIHAGSILLFGDNNFAVRFPSAAAVGLSAILIFFLVRLNGFNKESADIFPTFLSVIIFMSCGEVFGLGNTAVLDSLFSLFLTAAVVSFYFASEERPGTGKEYLFLILAGISCGLSFLTKGFLAFVMIGLPIASYLIWQKRYFDLIRMSWLPAVCAVITALPWCVAVHLKEPDFWNQFFWREHIQRFMSSKAQHSEPFWFYFVCAPGMFLPWTFVVPAAIKGLKAPLKENGQIGRLLKFCICWFALPLLFLSLSKGKLLTYILPCSPPFAILTAFGLASILRKDPDNKLFRFGTYLFAYPVAITLIAFVLLQIFGFKGFKLYHEAGQVALIITGVLSLIVFCFYSVKSKSGENKAILFSLAPLLCFVFIHYAIPVEVTDARCPDKFIISHQGEINAESVIITDKQTAGALCWYLKRDDIYVYFNPGELAYGFEQEDQKHRLLGPETLQALINQNKGNTFIICRAESVNRYMWKGNIPEPAIKNQDSPEGFICWRY